MTISTPFHDSLYHLAQVGAPGGVQLVRIDELEQNNQYSATPIEFDEDGETQAATDQPVIVTNLAEPGDADGQVTANTRAVAIDVEGRWIVHIRPPVAMMFPAKIINSQGSAVYTVREQAFNAQGNLIDKSGVSDVSAKNLAELSLGTGAAVDTGTIVVVAAVLDQASPPNMRYVFDHPAYAKYLD